MAEDQGNQEEKKFDFTGEGEAVEYITLPQAILLARRLARENDEGYKESFGWGGIVWTELRSETIGEDYYRVVLQFNRPQRGVLEAQTGEEEFLFDFTGILQDRQVLLWPEGLQMGEPERPPRTSGEEQEVAQAVTEKVSEVEEHFQQPEGDPEVYLQLASVAYGNQEYQEAIEHYTEAIQLDLNNAVAYYNRGLTYHRLGQNQRAIEDYDKAIQLDPNDALAYGSRGYAYGHLGESQRAIEEYDKAIQLDPYGSIAYYNRGYDYYNLGEHRRAIEDFDKAIQLDPNYAEAYANRGWAYHELGQASSAQQDWGKARSLGIK